MSVVSSDKQGWREIGCLSRAIQLLGELGVTPHHLQTVIDNPERRATVVAALLGDIPEGHMVFGGWVERELELATEYLKLIESPRGNRSAIVEDIRRIGCLTPNGRPVVTPECCVVGGLSLSDLFRFFYNYSGSPPLREKPWEEWWRGATSMTESFPTQAGLFYWWPPDSLQPDDSSGRPFHLDRSDHDQWCKSLKGARGMASVEQVLYLIQRHLLKTGGVMPFPPGTTIRCRNRHGSGQSLAVSIGAEWRLSVSNSLPNGERGVITTVPERFTPLIVG